METILENISRFFQQEKTLLLLGSGLGFVVFVLMYWFGLFPLDSSWFVFCTILMLLAALYRPAWVFLCLLTWLPLEVITLAPEGFGGGWRPYQWLALVLFVALGIRKLSGRPTPLFRWHWLDGVLMMIPLSVVISAFALGIPGSVRLGGVFSVFALLYLLARFFWRSSKEILAAVPFVALGMVLSLMAGLAQTILHTFSGSGFMVMPGRPNASFAEPDWYGAFLLVVIALGLALVKHLRRHSDPVFISRITFFSSSVRFLFLGISFLSLVLTVSRSAWLGAGMLSFIFIFLVSLPVNQAPRKFQWREGLFFGNALVVLVGFAVMIALGAGLTRFDLGSRAASTATGFQKITLACLDDRALPFRIDSLDELDPLGCRFITLEEIPDRENEGLIVRTILRPDPNVEIRRHIYETSFGALQEHPLRGIGWGTIGDRLGRDERGAALNASNIFLEVWLGAGIVGVGAFFLFLGGSIVFLYRRLRFGGRYPEISIFIASTLGGLMVFNLFNSGILLGWVWVFFALLPTQALNE